MYLYGENTTSTVEWNSVDVMVNGQLQHGIVVGVMPDALIVDFRCPLQRSVIVQYGRAYKSSQWPVMPEWDSLPVERSDVQVLLRIRPNLAWIWYPGRLHHYDQVKVKVRLPGRTTWAVLPRGQARLPPSASEMDSRRVLPGDFMISSRELPASFWDGITVPLLAKYKHFLDLDYCVHLVVATSTSLFYVKRLDSQLDLPTPLCLHCWTGISVSL
ncbi:uncharacterized protein LOC129592458 isoform X2 [Paramacrobiotus metropolitanus]|uniref:uncharacterized protein LOC129592458 isoform X2 n=1 Tax=Paramacrobiotus metropolitanus TaxID=2943436 RepID=UPI0024463F78|nr:uncharacterized protein LOC129592458 isoform X2 [Paramacrobiotus metropolitanus]